MSIKRITSVWDNSKHSGTTLLVLLAIADNADDNGLAWPGISTLAQRARVGERAVITHLKKLEAGGELLIYRRDGRHNYYILKSDLSEEQYQQALTRLAAILETSVETITTQFRSPVIKRSPGGDQAITGTSDPQITRSVIRTVSEPSISADMPNGSQQARPPEPAPESAEEPTSDPITEEAPEAPKAVQPHIAIIDAYWAGIPGGKPIRATYPRHVKVATAMHEAGIVPEDVTRFLVAVYNPHTTVFEFKKWHNKTITLEAVADMILIWKIKHPPPKPLIVPGVSLAERSRQIMARYAEMEKSGALQAALAEAGVQ